MSHLNIEAEDKCLIMKTRDILTTYLKKKKMIPQRPRLWKPLKAISLVLVTVGSHLAFGQSLIKY